MSTPLSSRLNRFGFPGRKASSANNNPSPPPNQGQSSVPPPNVGQVGQVVRPSSYPPPYQGPSPGVPHPGPGGANRPTSPMPPQGPYGPGQIGSIPPSLPPPGMMHPPPGAVAQYGHPPQYAGQPHMNHRDSHGNTMGHPNHRPGAAEVEGTNRSKAQLIVGIDFVSDDLNIRLHRFGSAELGRESS